MSSDSKKLDSILRELEKRELCRREFRLEIEHDKSKSGIKLSNEQIQVCKKNYSVKGSLKMENDQGERILKRYRRYQPSLERAEKRLIPYDNNNFIVDGAYLDASWVRGLCSERWWLAMRMPNDFTLYNFYSIFFKTDLQPDPRLTKKHRIRTVVQLNEAQDGARVEVSSSYLLPPKGVQPGEPYQGTYEDKDPPTDGPSRPPIKMTVQPSKYIYKSLLRRDITLTRGSETVEIAHLSYIGWPDMSAPLSMENHIHFIEEAEKINRGKDEVGPPMLVHCTAGLGRTGAHIIADDILHSANSKSIRGYYTPLGEIPKSYTSQYAKVTHGVDSIRERRPAMVLDERQIRYLFGFHDYICEMSKEGRSPSPEESLQASIGDKKSQHRQSTPGSSSNTSTTGSVSAGPGITRKSSSPIKTSRPSTPTPTERSARENDSNVQHKSHSPGSSSTGKLPKSITTSKISTSDNSKASLVKNRPSTPVTSSVSPIQRKRPNPESPGQTPSPRRASASGTSTSTPSQPGPNKRVITRSATRTLSQQQQPQASELPKKVATSVPDKKVAAGSSSSQPKKTTPSSSSAGVPAPQAPKKKVVTKTTPGPEKKKGESR